MAQTARTPRGREAQARRNDVRILDAALDVFTDDVNAPMSSVATRAGVGQASLYRRYPHREALLAAVSEHGMARLVEAAREALALEDTREAIRCFLEFYVESGSVRLTKLLGTFDPPAPLFLLASTGNDGMQALVDRAIAAGTLRADLTGADLTLIATQLGSLDVGDPERTAQLRRRYLALVLQALAEIGATDLPGPAPTGPELEAPWRALRPDATGTGRLSGT